MKHIYTPKITTIFQEAKMVMMALSPLFFDRLYDLPDQKIILFLTYE